MGHVADTEQRRHQRDPVARHLAVVLEESRAQLLARVWVKEEAKAFNETGVYGTSVASLTDTFQAQLADAHSRGFMVLDSRTKSKNAPNVHSITTRKYRVGGDGYKGVIESPVFGHSDTHTLLQLADLVVSALLFPIACHVYTGDLAWNVHCDGAYAVLREEFGPRLKQAGRCHRLRPAQGTVVGTHVRPAEASQHPCPGQAGLTAHAVGKPAGPCAALRGSVSASGGRNAN